VVAETLPARIRKSLAVISTKMMSLRRRRRLLKRLSSGSRFKKKKTSIPRIHQSLSGGASEEVAIWRRLQK